MAAVMYELILGRRPLLDQEALDLGAAFWQARHSRADEVEADQLAVGYLVRSGVDPRGMLSLLTTIWSEEQRAPGAGGSWFATHPSTGARVEATRERIRQVLSARSALARDNDSYPDFLRRLHALPPPVALLRPDDHPPVQHR